MAVKDIALDTNSYTAFKLNQPEAVEIIQHAHTIGVSSVVLGELPAGLRSVPARL